MRFFYNLLIYLLQLPVAAYWFFRGLVNPVYRERMGQRFWGRGYPRFDRCIWIHAVSVGEVTLPNEDWFTNPLILAVRSTSS